jgi:hypothetical protein
MPVRVRWTKTIVDAAAADGRWVIFAGHEIGRKAYQTTDVRALEQLCAYLKDSANAFGSEPSLRSARMFATASAKRLGPLNPFSSLAVRRIGRHGRGPHLPDRASSLPVTAP